MKIERRCHGFARTTRGEECILLPAGIVIEKRERAVGRPNGLRRHPLLMGRFEQDVRIGTLVTELSHIATLSGENFNAYAIALERTDIETLSTKPRSVAR